jgi:outer membrane PBP1 activator LpoA protein
LLEKMPDYVPFKINHAEALMANGRLKEAERVLSTIAPNKLSPTESQQYYYDYLQLFCGLGRLAEARQFLSKIDTQNLFPTQLAQFKAFEKQIDGASSKN